MVPAASGRGEAPGSEAVGLPWHRIAPRFWSGGAGTRQRLLVEVEGVHSLAIEVQDEEAPEHRNLRRMRGLPREEGVDVNKIGEVEAVVGQNRLFVPLPPCQAVVRGHAVEGAGLELQAAGRRVTQ